jgi:hypothetical protein
MANWLSAGLDRVLIALTYTSAANVPYMGGTAGGALANNGTSHALVLDSINNLTPTGGELTTLTFQGGDRDLGTMQFGSTGITNLSFVCEDIRNSVITALHGTAVDTTSNSEFEQWSDYTSVSAVVASQVGFITKLKDRDTGATAWFTRWFPSCQTTAKTTFGGFQAKNTMEFNVAISPATYHPLGTALSAMSMSLPDNMTDNISWFTTNRLHATVYRSDGTATTFVTGYRPLSSTVTVNATPNWFARNGTDQALSSISTTTGVATMAASGSAGDVNVLFYETNYVAI